jgi:hypothetical protein
MESVSSQCLGGREEVNLVELKKKKNSASGPAALNRDVPAESPNVSDGWFSLNQDYMKPATINSFIGERL